RRCRRADGAARLLDTRVEPDLIELRATLVLHEGSRLCAPLEHLAAACDGIGDLMLVADRQRPAAVEQVVDAARETDAVVAEIAVLVLAVARIEPQALNVAVENDVDDAGRRVGAVDGGGTAR